MYALTSPLSRLECQYNLQQTCANMDMRSMKITRASVSPNDNHKSIVRLYQVLKKLFLEYYFPICLAHHNLILKFSLRKLVFVIDGIGHPFLVQFIFFPLYISDIQHNRIFRSYTL